MPSVSELARALEDVEVNGATRTPEWLAVLVDAASLSTDDRLGRAAADLADELRRGWPRDGTHRPGDAFARCLPSVRVGRGPVWSDCRCHRRDGAAHRLASTAPVAGVKHAAGNAADGELGDHTDAARALLTAYAVTGRLPYTMLADDLMQFARRCWWDDEQGGFSERANPESAARSACTGLSRAARLRVCSATWPHCTTIPSIARRPSSPRVATMPQMPSEAWRDWSRRCENTGLPAPSSASRSANFMPCGEVVIKSAAPWRSCSLGSFPR